MLSVNTNYYGPMEEGLPHLAPLFALNPIDANFVMVPWNKLYTALFFGKDPTMCQWNLHIYTAGSGMKQTDVATFESYFHELTGFLREHPVGGAFVISRFPNDAVLAMAGGETAYGRRHREITTHLYVRSLSS